MPERRRRPRIAVQLPCYASSPNLSGVKLAAETRDVTTHGVLFTMDPDTTAWTPFEVGDSVSVEIALPADHDFGQRCIHGRGKVVRLSSDGDGRGQVAVHFNRAGIRELGEKPLLRALNLNTQLEM